MAFMGICSIALCISCAQPTSNTPKQTDTTGTIVEPIAEIINPILGTWWTTMNGSDTSIKISFYSEDVIYTGGEGETQGAVTVSAVYGLNYVETTSSVGTSSVN